MDVFFVGFLLDKQIVIFVHLLTLRLIPMIQSRYGLYDEHPQSLIQHIPTLNYHLLPLMTDYVKVSMYPNICRVSLAVALVLLLIALP